MIAQAMGQQTATAPAATASVTALTAKANPPADVEVEDDTQVPLNGTPNWSCRGAGS